MTVYPIVRLSAALLLMTFGGSAMYAAIVVLKPVAAEFGVSRGLASAPYTLFMLGFGLGGVIMGRLADRFGVRLPIFIASLALPAGFVLAAQATSLWQFGITLGVLSGLLGTSATFAPLVSDISHWFTKRRGLAVGIVISGTYLAGTVWPPVLQYFIDAQGWRQTFVDFGILVLCAMLPLWALLYRHPPTLAASVAGTQHATIDKPLGFVPSALQCMLCLAGIGCCVAMAMPQVHIVAHATDLGYAAARGTEMLSLMLGFGVVSRLISGWLSDHIGGLNTLLLGSCLQAGVLAAFLTTDTLTGLYVLSIAFGLSQGGIVPSYAIIVRQYFDAQQAGWRIGTVLLFTIIGMALGGWMAGVLYDLSGSYTASFINAIGFNVLNMVIAALLIQRAAQSSRTRT